MSIAAGLTVRTVLMFVFVVLTQIGGSTMLAKTDGFRSPWWTAACLGTYLVSIWVLASMIREGAPLNLLLPLLAAVVPLAVIAIGVTLLGESASLTRIAVLSLACVMVGFASTLK